ncbi:MAG: hypothetical protein C5B50_25745 [Verrucomicrobia bacterium]|nr:MAG: hypothetical protein C5B50_25745 [Verrucomicrobiota bacterium]
MLFSFPQSGATLRLKAYGSSDCNRKLAHRERLRHRTGLGLLIGSRRKKLASLLAQMIQAVQQGAAERSLSAQ